jgi:hypothetical protein
MLVGVIAMHAVYRGNDVERDVDRKKVMVEQAGACRVYGSKPTINIL